MREVNKIKKKERSSKLKKSAKFYIKFIDYVNNMNS